MQALQSILGNFETEEREFSCVEHGAYMSKVIRLGGETLTENRCPKCLAIEARIHEEAEARLQAEREAQKTRMAGVSKCANCRNSNRCPSNIKNSGAGLTCGGYQPY